MLIFVLLLVLPTTTMGTAGGYNGGNGAVTEGREGFPERIADNWIKQWTHTPHLQIS